MILYLLVLIFFHKDSSADTTNCICTSSSETTLYYNAKILNTCKINNQCVRQTSVQKTQDIFGLNSLEQTQVALGWDDVGMFDLNNSIDTYVITPNDDFNTIQQVYNFISTQDYIQMPPNAQINLIAGNWPGINQDFEVTKTHRSSLK